MGVSGSQEQFIFGHVKPKDELHNFKLENNVAFVLTDTIIVNANMVFRRLGLTRKVLQKSVS